MNKTFIEEIMNISNLRNKYLESRSEKDTQSYAKERNLCASLLRKARRSYYSTLNEKSVTDNRKLWKTMKPMLSNKLVISGKITLVEKRRQKF